PELLGSAAAEAGQARRRAVGMESAAAPGNFGPAVAASDDGNGQRLAAVVAQQVPDGLARAAQAGADLPPREALGPHPPRQPEPSGPGRVPRPPPSPSTH